MNISILNIGTIINFIFYLCQAREVKKEVDHLTLSGYFCFVLLDFVAAFAITESNNEFSAIRFSGKNLLAFND